MDFETYPSFSSLPKVFKDLIDALIVTNKFKNLGLTYESSTRSFGFADFDKLENLEPSEGNQSGF